MVEYFEAPEVEKIARGLIDENHPHLRGVRIDYLFRDKAVVSGDKIKLGSARKVTGLTAFLGKAEEPFFVIEIGADTWQGMSDATKKALVDHELSHCGITEKIKTEDGVENVETTIRIIRHDLEEFNDIVRRHGLWRSDIEEFASALNDLL